MKIVCNYTGEKIGLLYVKSENTCFPDDTWDDFCVAVISGWINDVNNNRYNSEFKLYFMDGPYYMLCKKAGEAVMISAVDDHDGMIVFSEKIYFSELQQQLISIAETILDYGFHREEVQSDLKLLKKELKKLIDQTRQPTAQ